MRKTATCAAGALNNALATAASRKESTMNYRLGLDFGTTNTALSASFDDGTTRLATFSHLEVAQHCRTALFFPEPDVRTSNPPSLAGDAALAACIDSAGEGRFIQSLKSFLASHSFGATQIFGAKFTLDALLDRFVVFLVDTMNAQFGGPPSHIVVGAPVNFAYAHEESDNAFARDRLAQALARGGLTSIAFALEPVAAAHTAQAELTQPATVVVADFGGGTSDFALVRVAPGIGAPVEVVGTSGVAIAGDAFDGKIVRHMVSQELGRGSQYATFGGEPREIPPTFFHKLERWHHLSMMNSPTTLRSLREIERDALEPEKIGQLLVIIEENLGFHLHAAVGATKRALSTADEATFSFDTGEQELTSVVTRDEFEAWISDDIAAIAAALDELLQKTETDPRDVDQVFTCGGTSFVPAVRRAIEEHLPRATLHGGSELVSIASGLAHIAALDGEAREVVCVAPTSA